MCFSNEMDIFMEIEFQKVILTNIDKMLDFVNFKQKYIPVFIDASRM